jgi:RNA polymerase sigma factor (sigma-70 family)
MVNTQLGAVVRHLRRLRSLEEGRAGSDGELIAAFTARNDQAAFAGLVERYGPLVLGVCRRVLRQEQDAEDAFQATFLVLAQSAGAIRKRESLGSWLYGVAYRVAMRARQQAARRRAKEAQARAAAPGDPGWKAAWQEVQAVLDA